MTFLEYRTKSEYYVVNANGMKIHKQIFDILFYGILSVIPYIFHIEGMYQGMSNFLKSGILNKILG